MFKEIPASKQSLGKRKPIHGVGINDADYITRRDINGVVTRCPVYQTWRDMLRRCYSDKYHKSYPTYIGCTTVKEWHLFSTFKEWMENQDWKGKSLDKDIKVEGNKLYSPDTCLFVSQSLNNLLCDHAAKRGPHAQGVSFNKASSKFKSLCSINCKQEYIGLYNSEEEASHVYKKAKNREIERHAKLNPEIAEYLLQHRYELI